MNINKKMYEFSNDMKYEQPRSFRMTEIRFN